jgi:hypothetical protein
MQHSPPTPDLQFLREETSDHDVGGNSCLRKVLVGHHGRVRVNQGKGQVPCLLASCRAGETRHLLLLLAPLGKAVMLALVRGDKSYKDSPTLGTWPSPALWR